MWQARAVGGISRLLHIHTSFKRKYSNMNTSWVSSGLIEDMDHDGDVDLKDVGISLAFLGGMIVAVFIKVLTAKLHARLTRHHRNSTSNQSK